jgi:hypothetical protein
VAITAAAAAIPTVEPNPQTILRVCCNYQLSGPGRETSVRENVAGLTLTLTLTLRWSVSSKHSTCEVKELSAAPMNSGICRSVSVCNLSVSVLEDVALEVLLSQQSLSGKQKQKTCLSRYWSEELSLPEAQPARFGHHAT